MKKLTLVISVIVACMFCVACQKEKSYRIGVSQCSQDDWRKKMNEEIEREIMFHPEASVEIRSADDRNEKQIEDIKYFADNGFDIIIAAPNEEDAITPVIREIYERGIPVIVFDRNIHGDTYTAFMGADNVAIGSGAAGYAANLLGGKGKIIELRGLKGCTPATERHTGFAATMTTGYPDISVIAEAYGNWNYEDAARKTDSLLDLYPDVDLVYAHNDRMAIAASDVSRRRGLHPYIIGIDAAPEIGLKAVRDTVIDATFFYPTEGQRLIRTAMAVLKGEPYDTVTRFPASSAVDLSNADILLMQNESLKEETSKMKTLKKQVDEYWDRHSSQTVLFYASLAIVLLLAGVLFLVLRSFWQHRQHQDELLKINDRLKTEHEKQKELNIQLEAATNSKLAFFTNVSHDLRTPLTLIAEPVEQLAAADNLTDRQRSMIRIAQRNVSILKRLINQILDFRAYENGKLVVNMAEADLGILLSEWSDAFRSAAGKRGIKFRTEIGKDDGLRLAVDVEKMERVVYNLLSNALKYTPANGEVVLSCWCDGREFYISVKDNGPGICLEDRKRIFDRFFQVDRIHPKGSGIGLSLAKAFVELHGGSLTLESEPGIGSEFIVRLPVRHVASDITAPFPAPDNAILEADIFPDEEGVRLDFDETRPVVLVIDDNEDIRRMLSALLEGEYNVVCASDGKEGLRLAARYVPDAIVCDVMMPVMDGLECCRRIKEELSTSHIPVLLLTACSLDEHRVQGYDSGADGYLSKPFSGIVLLSRIASLIANRRIIRNLWGSHEPARDGDLSVPLMVERKVSQDSENEFYGKFLAIVDREMGNPDLSVDRLAEEMGLGRSQFYRKIKAITNFSPVELLRNLRLKKARSLLSSTDRSISEIAYEVGFSTPAYFSKCYRDAFGETPSDLRNRL